MYSCDSVAVVCRCFTFRSPAPLAPRSGFAVHRGSMVRTSSLTPTTQTPYQLTAEPRIGLELMKVRTPEDALTFSMRFGLLRGTDGHGGVTGHVRQPAKDFVRAGRRLYVAARMIQDIRKAERQVRNNKLLIARIASQLPGHPDTSNTRELLNGASGWAAWEITDGFGDSSPFFFSRVQQGEDAPAGEFRFAVTVQDLLAACHLSVALALAERERMLVCEECESLFEVRDARQKFCTEKCAARNRFRRFREKEAMQGHGKKTRTR